MHICVSLWRHVHLGEMSADARRGFGSYAAQVTDSSESPDGCWQSGHLYLTSHILGHKTMFTIDNRSQNTVYGFLK